jgi:hypothetical protein
MPLVINDGRRVVWRSISEWSEKRLKLSEDELERWKEELARQFDSEVERYAAEHSQAVCELLAIESRLKVVEEDLADMDRNPYWNATMHASGIKTTMVGKARKWREQLESFSVRDEAVIHLQSRVRGRLEDVEKDVWSSLRGS